MRAMNKFIQELSDGTIRNFEVSEDLPKEAAIMVRNLQDAWSDRTEQLRETKSTVESELKRMEAKNQQLEFRIGLLKSQLAIASMEKEASDRSKKAMQAEASALGKKMLRMLQIVEFLQEALHACRKL
eukprot:CAMPEP_0167760238 /NCGR_PEP_ID=MMETSP0110_2-20121227/11477_1 /TAXON_ID=629695 /ORGANISM="Gymnochlora sp., Strain CCMP2014" /LENGTH=127 /DNA_ID=CAMNT_0007646731 /DNA_START=330 /DNA_END=713 /DNA_ORIENTATION=-